MLTITEALAEIKTLNKRITKKREFVFSYLHRQEMLKDPLADQGGSRRAIADELQGVRDLEQRIVAIRAAIQQANHANTITVEGTTKTVADWLAWRREVLPNYQQFLMRLRQQVDSVRQQATQKGLSVVVGVDAASKPSDVIVNVDEQGLAQEAEHLETIIGTLDGKLSLTNATITLSL